MSQFYNDIYPGMNKKFKLVIRESGQARDMGGDTGMSIAVGIVDSIFIQALEAGASDIHLQPEHDGLRQRLRIDGVLQDAEELFPHDIAPNIIARLKLAAGMAIDERRMPQDGRVEMEYLNRRLSGRVSSMPSLFGEKIVIRILDPQNVKIDLTQLGMNRQVLDGWQKAIRASYGMIIVTGPTGSGKTSTLYASINQLDRKRRNIVTVEDPIEYEFADNILQVGVSSKLPFARVMRSFLRQDPDVIMVGEMRDPESLSIGIQASLTGHLVLTSLHTNNAVETIGRMQDMQAEPYLIAATVIAIMGQRLVRVSCPQCREPYMPPPDEISQLGILPEEARNIKFMRGKGCQHCRGTGYRGRTGLFELLPATAGIREVISKRLPSTELLRVAKQNGMKTMLEDGIEKIKLGYTTSSEVLRAVHSSAIDLDNTDETTPITQDE